MTIAGLILKYKEKYLTLAVSSNNIKEEESGSKASKLLRI